METEKILKKTTKLQQFYENNLDETFPNECLHFLNKVRPEHFEMLRAANLLNPDRCEAYSLLLFIVTLITLQNINVI